MAQLYPPDVPAAQPTSPPPPPSPAASRQAAGKAAVANAVELYDELLELAVYKRATFLPSEAEGLTTLQLDTSHRSISRLNKKSGTQSITLQGTRVVATSPLSFTSEEVKHVSYSLDGTKSAVFRANAGEDKGLTLELWDTWAGAKLEEVDVGKEHGAVYFDDTFGPPSWSPDGTALVYTAEPNPPKSETAGPGPRDKFKYTPDHGETFTGKRFPSLFLAVFAGSNYHLPLSGLPSSSKKAIVHRLTTPEAFPGISFGQPIFLPTMASSDPPRILATGYSALPDNRKLGIVYCANRPAAIYELSLSSLSPKKGDPPQWIALSATRQSPEGRSARSPRLFLPSKDAKTAPLVVYLSNPEGGPHSSCATLHAVELKRSSTTVLVEQVDVPAKPTDFPGIFANELPARPFVVLGGIPHVVFGSAWKSRGVPLLVSLKDGKVRCLAEWPEGNEEDPVLPYLGKEKRERLKGVNVLGTDGKSLVVALRSGMASPPEVVVRNLASSNDQSEEAWKCVKKLRLSSKLSSALDKLDWTVVPLPKFEPAEFILLSPIKIDPAAEATVSLPPLITFPHGGPHAVSTTDWAPSLAALAIASYRVAVVNYPGSLGFGQKFVDALPPQLGRLDVDATLATSHYLNTLSLASRAKGSRFFSGGSHGGFIGTHLAGTYPTEFDAMLLRNPVTDLTTMGSATDIPDWVFAEAELPYSLTSPPSNLTPAQFEHLHSVSPSTKAGDVVVPTLLLVGQDDRRVPPDQSRAWYHALKRNHKAEVDMLVFPGNGHQLSSDVETEYLSFTEGLKFLEKYTVF